MPIEISKIVSHVPIFEAKSVVQLLPSTYKLLPSSVRQTLPGVSAESRNARSIERQFVSTDFINKLIQELDLYQNPEFITKAQAVKSLFPGKTLDEIIKTLLVEKIKPNVDVKNQSAELFSINVKDKSAEFAFSLAKTITDIYINEEFQRRMISVNHALEFNDEQ